MTVPELTPDRVRDYLRTWPAHRSCDPVAPPVAAGDERLLSAPGLPRNPQLLRRADREHDQLRADRVRAAILAVRFPDLAGQILAVPLPLDVDEPPDVSFAQTPAWRKADVREVVGDATVGELAAGFGRL